MEKGYLIYIISIVVSISVFGMLVVLKNNMLKRQRKILKYQNGLNKDIIYLFYQLIEK